jgi:phospholipase C
MRSWIAPAWVSMTVLTLMSCSAPNSSVRSLPAADTNDQMSSAGMRSGATASTTLKHIVIIIQENRSVDNLFNGFCVKTNVCADTVTTDPVSGTPLVPESLAAPFDPFHDRSQFVIEYDNGTMDGFPKGGVVCSKSDTCPYTVFDYVPSSETTIYQQLATVDGILSDKTFQTNQGPSFPAHLYAIGGQSGGYVAPDHDAISSGSGTCGKQKQVKTVDMTVPYPGKAGPNVPSCMDFKTVLDLIANKGHTWRYYSNSAASFWSAPQSIQHLYNSPNFVVPSTKFLTDVAAGTLADVTFVMPDSYEDSDHPGLITNPESGPLWVASLVNAVGESQFWDSSAIIVWWDDWGGFFDHVKPPSGQGPTWLGTPNPYEWSFRVPMMVISPYVRRNRIDHTPRTFVSAIRLIETTFKAGTLNNTDKYEPDDMTPMFNFNQKPRAYVPVGGSKARPNAHRGNGNPNDALTEPDGE